MLEISDIPPFLCGDSMRMRQILGNLLGNAVKFTAEGQIVLRAHRLEGNENMLRISVQDTGPGIAHAIREKLFEKFVQADTCVAQRFGGTGLGLAIAKHLVELMGGTIGVESEPEHGAEFWFTLPITLPDHDHLLNTAEQTLQSDDPLQELADKLQQGHEGTILMAEDESSNIEVANAFFEMLGLKVDVVNDGQQVLEALSKKHYDLVLMDLHMPTMTGIEATIAIREKENGGDQRVAIVAMTANTMPGDRARCLEAGMDDYLSKPIMLEQLVEVIMRWLPRKA